MQSYFYAIADFLQTQLRSNERFKCWFSAEETDFVRFNRGLIRQSGHVRQLYLNLSWIDGSRYTDCRLGLTGNLANDCGVLQAQISTLREQLSDLPPDPHFLIATEVNSTEHNAATGMKTAAVGGGEMVEDILQQANRHDFVGIFANGPMYSGFANSYGQRNWHQSASFNLDFSLYQGGDKAVKVMYAGTDWDKREFTAKYLAAAAQLEILKRPPVTIAPGAYRVYLAPAAMMEILTTLNWDAFSEKALRSKQSALRRMRDEDLRFHPMISLTENTAAGIAPSFQADGFIKPPQVPVIAGGRLCGSMIAPRSAQEYRIATNGAGSGEGMLSIDMAGGNLAQQNIPALLDTGIYISNLWYLNYSDRANCRLTGMTRFASFWVENGEIKAPLNVMRFDDSLYRMFGENLLGLSLEREMIIDSESYESRRAFSARLPGALVESMNFVL